MGKLIEALLKRRLKKSSSSSTQLLNLFTPFFSSSVNPKLNDTFMSCCQAHARHLSKIKPFIKFGEAKSEDKKYISNLLSLRPNSYMNAPTFWEKVGFQYFAYNNVFIYIDYDIANYKKPIKGFHIIDPETNNMEIRQAESGDLFLKFRLNTSEYITELDNVIHLARNVDASELFGEGNDAIKRVLTTVQTNYEGLDQAIRSSAFIRFLVKTSTLLPPDELKKKAEKFAEAYLGSSSSGVGYIDGGQEVIQVGAPPKITSAAEIVKLDEKMYNYFGINSKILQATYTEDEWQAYFESSIEPLIEKICAEATYKLFTEKELAHGSFVAIESSPLNTASMATRIKAAEIMVKLPVFKPNDVLDLLYLSKTKFGENEYATLNFVQADKQNQYQGTKEDPKDKEEPNDKGE